MADVVAGKSNAQDSPITQLTVCVIEFLLNSNAFPRFQQKHLCKALWG